jgi:myosin heavy subunit
VGTEAEDSSVGLVGVALETYLLEKSRVVGSSLEEGECNFHILHLLLNHPPADLRPLLFGSNCGAADGWRIITARSSAIFASSQLEAERSGGMARRSLTPVSDAFSAIGLNHSEIDGIWRILGGILHIANVEFSDSETLEGEVSVVENMTAIDSACSLLMVPRDYLVLLLTSRSMLTRGEKFVVKHTSRDSAFTRDAVVKAIYEALFNRIVKLVNRSLAEDFSDDEFNAQGSNFIGVLDIFGFENFTKNGFEQLMINYANETLQV